MRRVLHWMARRLCESPLARLTLQYPEAVGLLFALTFVYPLIAMAAQTYVLPTSGTDHQAEHLTNIANRDEALRSNFAGPTAPTSPTPVEGQSWYETDTDQDHVYYNGTSWYTRALLELSNVFLSSQAIVNPVSPLWQTTDSTNTVTARLQANDTEGRVGTSTNHPLLLETNSNARLRVDQSTGMLESLAACGAGFTRVGLWCYDTDGDLAQIRSASANETSDTQTVIGAGYKAAIIFATAFAQQDGTGEAASVSVCLRPGDGTVCSSGTGIHGIARAYLANEASQDNVTGTVRLDSSGQVRTRCTVSGALTVSTCAWYLVAYLN